MKELSKHVATGAEGSLGFLLRKWGARIFLRTLVALFALIAKLGRWLFRHDIKSTAARPRTLVLTGTFYSQNWILNHLRPLASSEFCSRIWLVCSLDLPTLPKVTLVQPPHWLRRFLGETPARLAAFIWTALRRRPDLVGGFHLLVNGMLAAALAPWIGARSLHICGGGFMEIKGGGWKADNRLFDSLAAPDPVLERQLVNVVNQLDQVITMGPRAISEYRSAGANTQFEIIPGGIDSARYQFRDEPKIYDLILVGQLIPVKRVDLFLRAVGCLKADHPGITATIVGAGRLEFELKALAADLGIQTQVTFAGLQADVSRWLNQSRIFVLTSDSEGLSLAMMEALMCGLPCVVSDVGELGELVSHGVNGCLVNERNPEAFARHLLPLVQDAERRERYSEAARRLALRVDTEHATQSWDGVLSAM